MEGSLLDVGTVFLRNKCVNELENISFFQIEKVSQITKGGTVYERLGQCPKFSRFLILDRSLISSLK